MGSYTHKQQAFEFMDNAMIRNTYKKETLTYGHMCIAYILINTNILIKV